MDRESFDRLMLEHLSAAHRLAIRLSGDIDRAEELVQEAMLRASRSWSVFRGQSEFTTWLFQIVINGFRDQLRRIKKGHDRDTTLYLSFRQPSCRPRGLTVLPISDEPRILRVSRNVKTK